MRTLTVTLSGDCEVVMTRVFDAPRHLVYEASTKPELVKRWLGAQGDWSLAVCEIDLRVGGAYRYVWRHPRVPEMGMGGVYLEIVPNERLVTTERFDDSWYPGEAVDTVTLTETGGRTTLTLNVRYQSREARAEALKTPMETGVAASYDAMAALLATMAAPRA